MLIFKSFEILTNTLDQNIDSQAHKQYTYLFIEITFLVLFYVIWLATRGATVFDSLKCPRCLQKTSQQKTKTKAEMQEISVTEIISVA